MIRITQLKLSINHTPEELSQKIRKELRLKNEGFTYEIVKQSLDCRHKEDKKFVYTVDVSLQDKNQESKIFRRVHNNNIMLTQKKEYTFPSPGEEELKYPPVIVGSGPAGIFCAWYLAKAGYRPLVLERERKRMSVRRLSRISGKMAYWIRIPMCSLVKGVLVLFPTEN
ncbi:MAG: NAD(P)-binding protein [Ruminococcus sp.]